MVRSQRDRLFFYLPSGKARSKCVLKVARLRAEANRVAEIVVVPDEISIPDLETGEFFDREVFADVRIRRLL